MHPVGHGLEEMFEELARDAGGGFLVQLDEGEFGGAVDRAELVELALLRPDLGDVDGGDIPFLGPAATSSASFRISASSGLLAQQP